MKAQQKVKKKTTKGKTPEQNRVNAVFVKYSELKGGGGKFM